MPRINNPNTNIHTDHVKSFTSQIKFVFNKFSIDELRKVKCSDLLIDIINKNNLIKSDMNICKQLNLINNFVNI
jgi:hypothetical protein